MGNLTSIKINPTHTLHRARRAPEKLDADHGTDLRRYGLPADVWALGITLVQLVAADAYAPYGIGCGEGNIMRQVGGLGGCVLL